MGWLLHQAGRLAEPKASTATRFEPAATIPRCCTTSVLLDDMDRKSEAVQAYEEALRSNPELADCHYNLALLCEALDRPKDAIRHMAQYRRLTERRGG
jgi:tetratricopeptide (TPR) repeat protein